MANGAYVGIDTAAPTSAFLLAISELGSPFRMTRAASSICTFTHFTGAYLPSAVFRRSSRNFQDLFGALQDSLIFISWEAR
jgi:hypothetical protein